MQKQTLINEYAFHFSIPDKPGELWVKREQMYSTETYAIAYSNFKKEYPRSMLFRVITAEK